MTQFNFGPQFRLKTKEDFLRLKDNSNRVNTYTLYYFYKNSANSEISRLGVAVSRKVGKANLRNRIKRILREEFRYSELKNFGLDGLFVVKFKTINEMNKEEIDCTLRRDFRYLVKKLKNDTAKIKN